MTDAPRVGLIWAQAEGGVIGRDGGMPWHVPEDLAHFKALTLGAPVVMGRRTWESFPARFRPLPGRRNIVITRNRSYEAPGCEVVATLEEGIALARTTDPEPLGPTLGRVPGLPCHRPSLVARQRGVPSMKCRT